MRTQFIYRVGHYDSIGGHAYLDLLVRSYYSLMKSHCITGAVKEMHLRYVVGQTSEQIF